MPKTRRGQSARGKKAEPSKAKMPVRHHVSSGGVLCRRGTQGLEVALIGLRSGKVWALPKGAAEPGEDPEATALREVQEETGLTGRCVGKIGEIEYWFVDREAGHRIHKRVHFFLLEHTGGDPSLHDLEVEEVHWVPLKEALIRLTYQSERETVEKASQMFEQMGRSV
ncbi:MAG: NUDIX hydrolase [Candidatus Methylomirabilales bacterium]